jgi:aspartate/methionine/tyrosine aminotransferase
MGHINTAPIVAARRLAAVEEYYFSAKLKEIASLLAAGRPVINLGIGSPDLPPAAAATESLSRHSASATNHSYQSYIGIPELRQAMAGWYQQRLGVSLNPEREVLPLLGSKEGIMHISMAFLDPGDVVLVPNPGYPTYRAAALLAGAQVVDYELSAANRWFPDLATLEAMDLSRVKMMWINYPHMPTGARIDKTQLAQLVDFARRHKILLVNDNPYVFILNDQPVSLLSLAGAWEVGLELNSMSKAFNMAGWRIGMLAGNEEYLQAVLRFKSNMDSGMFKPIQLAAVEALQLGDHWYDELNAVYRSRRQLATRLLERLDCRYDAQQAGLFVWAQIPPNYPDAYALSDKLLYEYDLFLTPGGIFGSAGNQYLRVSLCANEQQFLSALSRLEDRQASISTTS